MKLSASLYSKTEKYSLQETVKVLDEYGVEYFHIDCNDDLSVFEDIKEINSWSDTAIDLHIIAADTEKYIDKINESNIDRVAFQIEGVEAAITLSKIKNCKKGIAIHISNSNLLDEIKKYESELDFVLLMMTTPGKSGGKFEKSYFHTIQDTIDLFPNMKFCIDGGINNEVAYLMRLLGVESIVVGSYLLKNENIAQAILNINKRKVKSKYEVRDYLIPIKSLPIVDEKASIYEAMKKMDAYSLGMVFCTNDEGVLKGILTNADVRKVILRREFDYDMKVDTVLNTTPKKILEQHTTEEMINYVDAINFPILVLPVTDDENKLKGAISFHKILKEDF